MMNVDSKNEQQQPVADTESEPASMPAPDASAVDGGTPPLLTEVADLDKIRTEAAKAKENWLRTAADLENYKKRAARERQEAVKFANESLLEQLLPVLDNFEAALSATNQAQTKAPGMGPDSVQALQTGIAMVQQQFKKVLADAGLEEVDARQQLFDPNLHEAVMQQETTDVPEGHVVQQIRKGYKLRDRLLRPATVVVAKEPAK
jgi:molecular chaperone GrpE